MRRDITLRLRALAGPACAALLLVIAPAGAQDAPVRDVLSGCVPCHGEAGIAKDTFVPNLAGQNSGYLAAQLRAYRSGARRHPEMRVMTRALSTAEIEAIADYYAGLPPR